MRTICINVGLVTAAGLAAQTPSSDDLHREAVARADAAVAAARPITSSQRPSG